MFHHKLSSSEASAQNTLTPVDFKQAASTPQTSSTLLKLVRRGPSLKPGKPAPALLDLAIIAARRCSSFFAEAAVLVLVFGILDYFMLKGRIELAWIAGALAISVALLAASVAMDFSAHRWIKAHP
jgi:hypothetical protein